MNIKHKVSILLVFVSLALGALPAGAVSYNGAYYLNRYNTGGTSQIPLRPHRNNFCFLSRVGVRETDTGSEAAICTVSRSGSDWRLFATLGRSSDNDVFCAATCYTTN